MVTWLFLLRKGECMNLKIQITKMTVLIFLALFFFSFSAMATDVGGIIDTDTTWDLAGSPYNITSNVQVDEGVTLTIDPGVLINGEGLNIEIWGVLNAFGTDILNIILNNVDIEPQNSASTAVVNIQFVQINSGCPFDGYGSLTLLDSKIQNTRKIDLRNPGNSHVERNIFLNAGGIKIVYLVADTVYVRNNIFFQQTTDYAIVPILANVVAAETIVEHNSFLSTDRIALMLDPGELSASMIAINNYWNTTNTDVIDLMIYDRTEPLRGEC